MNILRTKHLFEYKLLSYTSTILSICVVICSTSTIFISFLRLIRFTFYVDELEMFAIRDWLHINSSDVPQLKRNVIVELSSIFCLRFLAAEKRTKRHLL